jgi:GMP synthase (glutamine-hydrolysing)
LLENIRRAKRGAIEPVSRRAVVAAAYNIGVSVFVRAGTNALLTAFNKTGLVHVALIIYNEQRIGIITNIWRRFNGVSEYEEKTPLREKIILLDFGAQYSRLIAKIVRENHVYCEILPYNAGIELIRTHNPKGIILSGGPASVMDKNSPRCVQEIFTSDIPVLGICYGMQLMAYDLGGVVTRPDEREYGKTEITLYPSPLFKDMDTKNSVWMSHTYQVNILPPGFKITAASLNCPAAAIENQNAGLYGVQFHPEVTHTAQGNILMRNFLYHICGCRGDWHISSFVEETVEKVRRVVGNKEVLLGLSGGVDSAVAAALLHKAVDKQLTCVFVDHGLLRKNEREDVRAAFMPLLKDKLIIVDASQRFLAKLSGVSNPEKKRKIIGKEC